MNLDLSSKQQPDITAATDRYFTAVTAAGLVD